MVGLLHNCSGCGIGAEVLGTMSLNYCVEMVSEKSQARRRESLIASEDFEKPIAPSALMAVMRPQKKKLERADIQGHEDSAAHALMDVDMGASTVAERDGKQEDNSAIVPAAPEAKTSSMKGLSDQFRPRGQHIIEHIDIEIVKGKQEEQYRVLLWLSAVSDRAYSFFM